MRGSVTSARLRPPRTRTVASRVSKPLALTRKRWVPIGKGSPGRQGRSASSNSTVAWRGVTVRASSPIGVRSSSNVFRVSRFGNTSTQAEARSRPGKDTAT